MPNIKAIILDLDDTVCLTEEACFYLENATLTKLGRPPMSREIHLKTWGKPLFDAIVLRSPGVDVAAFRVAYEPLIKSAVADGKLDSIAHENLAVMDTIIEAGKELLILTSREHSELAHMLKPGHDLAKRISTFYYRDNMQFHKPDPRAFEHIERDHGWQPSECVYVGDSIGDAEAAKGAGLHFVASLESGLRRKEDFAHLPVDVFIKTFTQLPEAIRQIETGTI